MQFYVKIRFIRPKMKSVCSFLKKPYFPSFFYVLVMFSSTNKSKFLMKLMLQTCSYSYFF
ncbi:hypothetical protein JHK82_032459 [Glycine max]|uniref:Uncharacterized protein n=1 Tax=Glycine max TaxID=3847 RepID=K7LSC7_SOYBN|nr:hypothetical protein JHK85_033169 [Glycine max]KAG4984864.1 hypothetical protein JHK86_032555 [Glycine max]KAG5118039.1 hypothetical protein JHK82_032459 [Glycine max]KAG5139025.1 hypothetical protein JHK84_032793 [Glycine max]KAH1141010.1 hypothetical protein GYH30_032325 [Glycine max]